MCGSLVRMCSSTRIPPRAPISRPAVFASVVSGLTPIARITTSAGYVLPDVVFTSSAPPSFCSKPVTLVAEGQRDAVPLHVLRGRGPRSRGRAGARSCCSLWRTVTSKPAWTRFSAVSRPMNPPPTTTARRRRAARTGSPSTGTSRRGNDGPAPRSTPGSSLTSGTVLTWKIPGRSIPGQRRMDRGRAGRQDELVVALRPDLAGLDVRRSTVFFFRSIATASHFVRTSISKIALNVLLVSDEEIRLLRDHARDVIREPAVRIRDERPPSRPSGSRPSRPGGGGAPRTTRRPPLHPR